MKAHIVRIGNSRGIRLPKTLLQEAQLEDEVELQAESGRILISKPSHPRPRWADAARACWNTMTICFSIPRHPLSSIRKSGNGDSANNPDSR